MAMLLKSYIVMCGAVAELNHNQTVWRPLAETELVGAAVHTVHSGHFSGSDSNAE